MPKDILNYTNNDLTVVWKPKTCIHSTLCWKGLIAVFNPRERPWIKLDGAKSEQIIEQVSKCPSGALSYFLNKEVTGESGKVETDAEAVSMVKIEVSPNGPYLIRSECVIAHADGKEETKTGTIALCRCGNSHNKPYCDGTHREIAFNG